jgi:hypothetical protein
MHSAPGTLAVVAAPLPAADRRGLSQAWYSALHLAEGDVRRTPSPRGPAPAVTVPRAAATSVASASPAPPGDRRDPPSRLARTIVRAVQARSGPTASTVVASEHGRVHLVVRVDGRRTRIVALCSEADRVAVERALGSARYALARTGALLDVAVRTER